MPKKTTSEDDKDSFFTLFEDMAGRYRSSLNGFLTTMSRTFFAIIVALTTFIALFSYVAFKIIVSVPEPSVLMVLALVIITLIILGLIIGLYRVIKWYLMSRIVRGFLDFFDVL